MRGADAYIPSRICPWCVDFRTISEVEAILISAMPSVITNTLPGLGA